jgi:GDP/UDP-N,N'-diacetylbacillosamine 2-epimerase (hydrolysing)
MTRKICYITGTRADFGLMQSTLQAIQRAPQLDLSIIVTGMHLSERYGNTVHDIQAAGLPVTGRVEVGDEPATGATMACNIGKMIGGFVASLSEIKPDMALLLGDRGEMLAGAIAAIHLGIPIAHIHGGERSGTVDEPVRHAVSKLSHFHFTSTQDARDRLIRMGEQPDNIYVTGAPGLDGIEALNSGDRAKLMDSVGLDASRPVALMVYHPVLQEESAAGSGAEHIIDALRARDVQVMALKPNSDAGSQHIRRVLEARESEPGIRVATHFPRDRFISWMAMADIMIGNSSAGIIEAGSFGTPVINIGTRQNLRERNQNVTDVPVDIDAIAAAVDRALAHGRYPAHNVYGDGQAAERIVSLLQSVILDSATMMKTNAY